MAFLWEAGVSSVVFTGVHPMSRSIESLVGSLIAIPNSVSRGARLGLVVDQEAGARWIARDPFPPHKPELIQEPLIVRLLGLSHEQVWLSSEQEKIWGQEPVRIQTVRWGYVQIDPNPPQVLAESDVGSIEHFLDVCNMCSMLGMSMLGLTFMGEVGILLDHLKQVTKPVDDTGIYERRYRAMLADVLPLRA